MKNQKLKFIFPYSSKIKNDKIVAIAHKETKYEAFLQIRPGYEFLADEMLDGGLRRLKNMGAEKACVHSWGNNVRKFYNSAGFVTCDSDYPWKKKY